MSKICIFSNSNFRTRESIRNQIKTCPEGQVWKLWLVRTQFPRHKCMRGIPDDLIAFHLSNLHIVKPATDAADCEPWF